MVYYLPGKHYDRKSLYINQTCLRAYMYLWLHPVLWVDFVLIKLIPFTYKQSLGPIWIVEDDRFCYRVPQVLVQYPYGPQAVSTSRNHPPRVAEVVKIIIKKYELLFKRIHVPAFYMCKNNNNNNKPPLPPSKKQNKKNNNKQTQIKTQKTTIKTQISCAELIFFL